MSYIQEIIDGNVSDDNHKSFIRFSKGTFIKEPIEIKKTKSKITIYSGLFDTYMLLEILAKVSNPEERFEISGILHATVCPESFKDVVIEKGQRKKNIVSGEIYGKDLADFISHIRDCYPIFKMKSKNFTFQTKKSLPKINKNVDRFSKIILPIDGEEIVRKELVLDTLESGNVTQTFEITDLEYPSDLNPDLIRNVAKRKGKFIRAFNFGDSETKKEYDLLA